MADIFDVADYALRNLGSASTMKLQKIIFYGQAWHLVRHATPLFSEEIQAWANGPVIPKLFRAHRHEFVISDGYFSDWVSGTLDDSEKQTLDHVIELLGEKTGAELSELTHSERPWLDARGGLAAGAPSHAPISQSSLVDFYSSSQCENPVFA